MNALLRKEIRLILPAGIVAVVLATLQAWMPEPGAEFVLFAFGLGLISLGLAPFGQEFSSGTFSILLAQPVSRDRIWRTKVMVLTVALVLVWFVFLVCLWWSPMLFHDQAELRSETLVVGGLFLLVAFSGGLWTTLLFRQVAAALWLTVLVPASLCVATGVLFPGYFAPIAGSLLVLYGIAGFLFARWLFFHAQDAQWTGGTISLPAWLGAGSRSRSVARPPGRKPLRALIRKEFQSHHIALLLGAGMLVAHLAVIGVRRMAFDATQPNEILHTCLEFWWALWFGLPFLVGSTAVAEERKLGTLEPQLCLPTTRRAQFAVKLGVALLLGIFLGGFMPVVTEAVFGVVPGTLRNDASTNLWTPLLLICSVAGAITVVSFYASTFTRNLLQAMGVAVVVGLALMAFGAWVLQAAFGGFNSPRLWVGPLVVYIGLPALLVTVLWLAFRNFKHVYVGFNVWRRNLLTVLASMAFIVVATTLIYNRTWEFFMTHEPKHGPARLSGSVRPKLCIDPFFHVQSLPDGRFGVGRRVFALLPDGRLWVTTNYRWEREGHFVPSRKRSYQTGSVEERVYYKAVPVKGTFLATSNWVSLASSDHQVVDLKSQVVGLQSDGSLWNVHSLTKTNLLADLSAVPEPERIGSDSDWKAIVAGSVHFLALKADGSIWGWGNNHNGQLGVGPEHFTDGPVRIGTDSDWAAVLAGRLMSIGVKRDGSVWKWGYLYSSPRGSQKNWTAGTHPEPVRLNLDGADWVSVAPRSGFDLVLKKDGSLWAEGEIQGGFGLFGNYLFARDYTSHFAAKPLQVGTDSDWADIANGSSLLGLKRNGTILQSRGWGMALAFWGEVWQPSRYSDWVAVGASLWDAPVTLAADGTLCSWGDPWQQTYENLDDHHRGFPGLWLLGPSRKPVWSVNIFADATQRDLTTPGRP
ncbi:MAG: ABC transporter permease [Limisphaerales bacterium]